MFLRSSLTVLLVFFSLSVKLPAETNAEKQAKQGAQLMYNFELIKAEQIFVQVKKNFPSDPIGYYYHAQIYLWSYLGNAATSDLNRFISLSDEAIDKTKPLLDDNTTKQYANLLLGNIFTQRVLALGKASKFVDMAWAGKKANSYLNDVIEANPDNADAYLGIGLFKFALSQIPSAFRYVLKIVGFDGNLKDGIANLKMASAKSTFTRVESQFYYAQIVSDFLTDYTTATDLLSNLQSQYPGNVLFSYALAVVHLKNHKLVESKQLLMKILQSKTVQYRQLKAYTMFLLGDVAYIQNDFQRAEQWYKRFLADAPDKSYTGIAAFRLGFSQEAMGNKSAATASFERAANGDVTIDDDYFASNRSKWFRKFKVNAEDIMLMRYSHLTGQGRYAEALDSLLMLKRRAGGKISVAELYYQIGLAFLYQKNYTEANRNFTYAATLNEYHQNWITAFSYLYAAKAEFHLGDFKSGKILLEKAEGISDFEFGGKFKMDITAIKYNFNLF